MEPHASPSRSGGGGVLTGGRDTAACTLNRGKRRTARGHICHPEGRQVYNPSPYHRRPVVGSGGELACGSSTLSFTIAYIAPLFTHCPTGPTRSPIYTTTLRTLVAIAVMLGPPPPTPHPSDQRPPSRPEHQYDYLDTRSPTIGPGPRGQ